MTSLDLNANLTDVISDISGISYSSDVRDNEQYGNWTDWPPDTVVVDFYFTIREHILPPAILWIEKWSPLLWYIIGFPGNILALIVWLQPRMRQSSGYYLVALALADLVFMTLNIVYYLYMTWDIRAHLDQPGVCEGFPVVYYASQYLSPLFVLGFTVERYISICYPFQRQKYCTTRRALMVIVLLCVISLALSGIQGYIYQYNWVSEDISFCDIRQSATVGGLLSLRQVWSYFTEILIFGLVPILILIINIRVLVEIRRITGIREDGRLSLRGEVRMPSRMSWVTRTLLAVSFYLIITTLPVTVVYLLLPVFPFGADMTKEEAALDPTWRRHFVYDSVKVVIQAYGMSRYSFNFYIYLFTGKNFRNELLKLFYKLCPSYTASNDQS